MIFEPNEEFSGFCIDRVEAIPDIEATAYIGRHVNSGVIRHTR